MKIKHIVIIACCLFATYNTLAKTGDCSYLEATNGTSYVENTQKWTFGYYYNIELCKAFAPITEEAEQYVQSIKNMKWKTIQGVITDIGNKLCRGDFGDCGKKSFSDRYQLACTDARKKAIKQTDDKYKSMMANDTMYAASLIDCPALADKMLVIFKDVAYQEAGRYHEKIIEESNKKYLAESHNLGQSLTNTISTVMKKLSSVAQHFEWFTEQVYNTGAQIMS